MAQFVTGVALHGYSGGPDGMSEFHSEFPMIPLHSTEASVFGLKGGVELIEKLRTHASTDNAWGTILDDKGKPNNGPFEASRTIITLNPTTRKPAEHFDFFRYGHFMKFIQRGACAWTARPARAILRTSAFAIRTGAWCWCL